MLLLVVAAVAMALLVAGRFFGTGTTFHDVVAFAERGDRRAFPVPGSQPTGIAGLAALLQAVVGRPRPPKA